MVQWLAYQWLLASTVRYLLCCAIIYKHLFLFLLPSQKVQRYLKELQDHNELNEHGDTLLHAIVRRKDKYRQECLLALLVYGRCDVDGGNMQGFTPLHIAAEVAVCVYLVCIERLFYCIVALC